LKQVPSCEFFPIEAVKTNIIGTDNVLETAIDCGVERVVCLSTYLEASKPVVCATDTATDIGTIAMTNQYGFGIESTDVEAWYQ
ncbi:polysaccharide biosynthesis protein, partial [Erysipelothrix rhusiopathiae]|nr:polysaccharide biosynthesis protein [Erysipelothrix rhusiopathiae]